MRQIIVILLVILPLLSSLQTSAGWTTYKHDMMRTGLASEHYSWEDRIYEDYRVAWSFEAGLCIASSPVLADLDGDGLLDASFASCDGYEYAVRGIDGALLWKVKTGGGLVNPSASDVDGDGVPEVVVGGSSGRLYCIDGRTGEVQWIVNGYFQKATTAIGDVDGDGGVEIVANELDGHLAIVAADGNVEHRVKLGDSPAGIPSIGDVNGDGVDDVVVGEGEYIHVVTVNSSGPALYTVKMPGEVKGSPLLYDVTSDGALDIIVVAGDRLVSIDFKDKEMLWDTGIGGDVAAGPSIGDIDGDGLPEIVVSTSSSIEFFSLAGQHKGSLEDLEAYKASPIIVDIDGDGACELLLAEYAGDLEIASYSREESIVEWLIDTGSPLMAPPAVGDMDGDGLPEIIFGSRDFHLYCIDGIPGQKSTIPGTAATSSPQPPSSAQHGTTNETGGPRIEVSTEPGERGFSPNYILILGLLIGASVVILLVYKYT